jgi:hypothetical protein
MRNLSALHSWAAFLCLAFSCLGIDSCSSSGGPTTMPLNTSSAPQWVATWGASPENALLSATNPGGSEQSYRFILLPTTAGKEERVHFSNLFGTTPLTIGGARLAVATGAGPAVDTTRSVPLTFNGSSSVTLAAGQETVSDAVNITYSYGEHLAVSMYLHGSFGPLVQHDSQVTTNFIAAAGSGNTISDTAGTAFATSMTEWFVLSGVDVYGPYQGTVAIFGSSSVDGHGSDYGNSTSYPTFNSAIPGQDNDRPSDWLARQLMVAGYNMGVLNAGTLGDPAGEDISTANGSVIAGVDRMQHDVLQQAGIKTVVIYFGGVDLRFDCVPATNVEASLTNMVNQANSVGVRVILATLPPSEYCTTSSADLLPSTANPWQGDINPGPENPGSTQRRLLNTWIKTNGSQLPGVVGIADFDAALLYPAHPDFMMPNYVSSDNFHPNGRAYGIQSGAIPLDRILGQ